MLLMLLPSRCTWGSAVLLLALAGRAASRRRRKASGSLLTSDVELYSLTVPVRESPADTMTMARVDTPRAAAIARRKACASCTVRTHGDGAPTPSVMVAVASTEYSISSAPAADAEIVVVGVCEDETDCEGV
jgi:hypothetical protein